MSIMQNYAGRPRTVAAPSVARATAIRANVHFAAGCDGAGYLRRPLMTAWALRQLRPGASRAVAVAAGGPFEELADRLGDDVHADLNGWRLYLRDMKSGSGGKSMAQAVAEQVGAGASVEEALKNTTISLGGGKKEISLFDAMPSSAVNNAKNAVRDLDL